MHSPRRCCRGRLVWSVVFCRTRDRAYVADLRNIRSQRQHDTESGIRTDLLVVVQQPFADITRAYPDDRIFRRVIGRRTPEQLDSERALLQLIEVPLECVFDDVAQEILAAPAPAEYRALHNIAQMFPQLRCVGSRFSDSGNRSQLAALTRFALRSRHCAARISQCADSDVAKTNLVIK